MKIVGILGVILFLVGGLLFIVGLVVVFNTWNSDYATAACAQAERDSRKFESAKEMCGNTNSACYSQATIGLISQEECENKTAFMQRQMMMGIVPAVLGAVLGIAGFCMGVGGLVLSRRKRTAT